MIKLYSKCFLFNVQSTDDDGNIPDQKVLYAQRN